MWKRLANLFKARDLDNEYLSNSVDLCDLERRMRTLQRGQAPHQLVVGNSLHY